jgi:Flp pilus assembly protein TadG
MITKINKMLDRTSKFVRAIACDNRGVAAIEFAFIAPLLITLYLGTLEISGALQMNKKLGRAASTTGDLIAAYDEDDEIPRAVIRDLLRIGTAATQPYNLTKPTMTVTGVDIDSAGAKVAWSQKFDGTSFTPGAGKNTAVVVPAKVRIPGTFLIKMEAKIQYRTLTSWTIKPTGVDTFGSVDMSEAYHYRPRHYPKLICVDCNPT